MECGCLDHFMLSVLGIKVEWGWGKGNSDELMELFIPENVHCTYKCETEGINCLSKDTDYGVS